MTKAQKTPPAEAAISRPGPSRSDSVAKKTATPAAEKPAANAKPSRAAKKVTPRRVSGFLAEQTERLQRERAQYLQSAQELKAQADSLAFEHEPGDVQFDEEGGEGGTSNVDRELDLVLSAQALAAVNEIDWALERIAAGTYGACEKCGEAIPEARLEALPHASLCVACKSGGLSSRR